MLTKILCKQLVWSSCHCQHSCSAVVSFLVAEDINQGSNPILKKKKEQGSNPSGSRKAPLDDNIKNSGRMPACATCGWFGPFNRVVAVIANTMGRGWHRLWCGPTGFFLVQYRGEAFPCESCFFRSSCHY